tara:strand:- start:195 stop:362 length:168 start_codon:yes stop_codon:yes gene_type:complete
MNKVDRDQVEEWITGEEECIEIITDLINGDYTLTAMRQDIEEWSYNRKEFWNNGD